MLALTLASLVVTPLVHSSKVGFDSAISHLSVREFDMLSAAKRHMTTVFNLWKRVGTKETLVQVGDAVGHMAMRHPRGFRVPTLAELDDAAAETFQVPFELLRAVCPNACDAVSSSVIEKEYGDLRDELESRYEKRSLPYDRNWAIESASSMIVYGLTRLLKPQVIVETGVANGHSSFLLLKAIEMNGDGHLHSVDVGKNVGGLIDTGERANWYLHVLNPRNARSELTHVLDSIGDVEMFIHDSDHRYSWQKIELELAAQVLNERGIIACDDADASFAFVDFARRHGKRSLLLIDRRKVFGVIPWRGIEPSGHL